MKSISRSSGSDTCLETGHLCRPGRDRGVVIATKVSRAFTASVTAGAEGQFKSRSWFATCICSSVIRRRSGVSAWTTCASYVPDVSKCWQPVVSGSDGAQSSSQVIHAKSVIATEVALDLELISISHHVKEGGRVVRKVSHTCAATHLYLASCLDSSFCLRLSSASRDSSPCANVLARLSSLAISTAEDAISRKHTWPGQKQ